MEFWNEALLLFKSFQLQRNPNKTKLIFEIIRIAGKIKKNRESIEKAENLLLANADFRSMWEEKWFPTPPTKKFLREMPEASLGKAYLNYLEAN